MCSSDLAAITVAALPEYLSFIVPLGRAVYGGYESPLALVVWQRDFIFVVPLIAALLLVRRRPAASEAARLGLMFAGAALAGIVVFLLQMKGWRYQVMPAISFASIGLGMALPYLLVSLWPALAHRLARAYGGRVGRVLGGAENLHDLGPEIAPGLHEAELRYLVREEWAQSADDVLWRRSKLGLHLQPAEREQVAAWFARAAD